MQFNLASYFLDAPAARHPERIAILGEPAPVTYGELAALANRAGNALKALGCEPGDRVLIVLTDSAEFIAAFLGAAKIGAIAVPVNPMTRRADYAYYLADSGARFVIAHANALPEFFAALESAPAERVVIVGTPGEALRGEKFFAWEHCIAAASPKLEAHPTLPTDMAFFLYTSGSGGQPKAAIHQHKDMLYTSRGFAHGVLGIREDDRCFSVSKLFFAYGLGNGMYFPLFAGASTILNPERPRVERVIEMVARHRPTIFFAVPTFYAALLRNVEQGASADFSSVRLAVSAGEWLPPEIFEKFRSRFGLEILDAIGSTEMLHMFLASRPGEARAGSCGYEVAGYEAEIVNEHGDPVPPGKEGSLWVSGGSAFAGYWQKPELTASTKRGNWVVTGDQFVREPDGFYRYLGRTDDMMKVSGMWVSPGEVENALLSHGQVGEAAVVAEITPDGLTRTVAYVVARAGVAPGAALQEELRDYIRGRLAGYKCPQEVRFLSELPKTATGKIQRFKLRAGDNPGCSSA